MTSIKKSRTLVASLAGKPPTDAETLACLAAALERIFLAEYQQMVAAKLGEFKRRLWTIDRVLTACPKSHAMDGLADMVQGLHDCLADVAAVIERRSNALDAGGKLGPARVESSIR